MNTTNNRQPAMIRNEKPDIPVLTGLRFFAAASIFFGHFAQGTYVSFLGLKIQLSSVTIIGMPLFFVLSGFVIHLNYGKLFAENNKWISSATFIAARVARLFPLFLFFLGVNLFVQNVIYPPFRSSKFYQVLLPYVTGTFSWAPIWIESKLLIQSFFGISWSISTELFFYVCYPIYGALIWRTRSTKRVGMLTVLFWISCLAWLLLVFNFRHTWSGWAESIFPDFISFEMDFQNSFFRWFTYVSPYLRMLEFLSGVLAAQFYLRLRQTPTSPAEQKLGVWISAAIILMIMSAVIVLRPYLLTPASKILGSGRGFISFLQMNFFFAIPVALLLIGVTRYNNFLSRFFSWAPFIFLGNISYSLYLSHLIINGLFPTAEGALSVLAVAAIFAKCALTVVLSAGTYSLIEVPGRRLVKSHLLRMVSSRRGAMMLTIATLSVLVAGLTFGLVRYSFYNGDTMESERIDTVLTGPANNKLWPSEGFNGGNWSLVENVRLIQKTAVGPNGQRSVVILNEDDSSGRHRIEAIIPNLRPDKDYVFSVYVKAIGRDQLMIELRDFKNTRYGVAAYNVRYGKTLWSKGVISDIGCRKSPNGWMRCWAKVSIGSEVAVATMTICKDGVFEYQADGTLGMFICGAQFSEGSALQNYVATIDGPR